MIALWPVMALGAAMALLFASRLLLHYFQLESYQFQGYFRTLLRQWKKAFFPGAVLFAVMAILHFLLSLLPGAAVLHLIAALAMAAAGLLLSRKAKNTPQKKKFVITARVKRLYAVHGVVFLALMLICYQQMQFSQVFTLLAAPVLALLLPVIVALSGVLALPIEKNDFSDVFP